jgi:pyruvate,water dikinase
MDRYVLGFGVIDQTQIAVAGGKGAHLGELSRIEGIRVPAGFCVTTDAFQRIWRKHRAWAIGSIGCRTSRRTPGRRQHTADGRARIHRVPMPLRERESVRRLTPAPE